MAGAPRRSLLLVQLGLAALFALRCWSAFRSLHLDLDARVLNNAGSSRHLSEIQEQQQQQLVEIHEEDHKCGSISKLPREQRCDHAGRYCRANRSIVNYVALHYCSLGERAWISLPLLFLAIVIFFHWLAETAEHFFSPVAALMVDMLKMSPTMGGVTLLALGNGAPDVFASMAAIGGGNSRIGLGAIISAGTFVSAFVVGCVALVAAPFSVNPVPFVRDVLFYSAAVVALLLVYLKGVVTFWQAVGMVFFYLIFIVVVVLMDQVKTCSSNNDEDHHRAKTASDEVYVEVEAGNLSLSSLEAADQANDEEECKLFSQISLASPSNFWWSLKMELRKIKVKPLLRAPAYLILRATIPETNPSKWDRYYSTANVVLCPLLVLFMFRSVVSLDYRITFFLVQQPLWTLVLFQNTILAVAYFLAAKKPPESTQILVAFMAFVMSVFWISSIAGEVLGCLAAVGLVSGVSPALLGLTVLAWGNSMGDLVADIAIARSGKPDMAIAGCFAGPMFNMLVGLGFALVLHTSYLEPAEYYLPYHTSITIAFGFLVTSLLGSLLVVASSRFQVTRLWGLCLIGLYLVFTLISVLAATILL